MGRLVWAAVGMKCALGGLFFANGICYLLLCGLAILALILIFQSLRQSSPIYRCTQSTYPQT